MSNYNVTRFFRSTRHPLESGRHNFILNTTLLFCANMEGSEKLKPVFISNAENPRCFNHKRIKKQNLPVHYYSNKSSWMTSEIFKEWLDKLNSKFKSENRNVLLYLDNFSGHYRTDKTDHNYSNIKIHFYPPNCTSVIQPMDQGIINAEKIKYKNKLFVEN